MRPRKASRIYWRLTHEMGHFEGQRWPKGTEVQVRVYQNDPGYLELLTPDGYWLTVTPLDVEQVVE